MISSDFRERWGRGDMMAKQGMKRPDRTHVKPHNEMPPIPELQGKAQSSNEPAKTIAGGAIGSNQKVPRAERLISKVYPVIDNDLARDNVKNDLLAADVQDL